MRLFKRKPKPAEPVINDESELAPPLEVETLKPVAEIVAPVAAKLEPSPEPTLPALQHLPVEQIKSRKWTAEEVDTALLCLAVHGGHSLKASEELAGRGIEIKANTLQVWKIRQYPERYRYIQHHHGSQLEDVLVRNQREVAVSATLKALEGLDTVDLDQIDQKDRPKAIQALQTTAGIATDKVLTLTGRPTQVTEHRDYRQVLAKYGGAVIEGEAEELTESKGAALSDGSQP